MNMEKNIVENVSHCNHVIVVRPMDMVPRFINSYTGISLTRLKSEACIFTAQEALKYVDKYQSEFIGVSLLVEDATE